MNKLRDILDNLTWNSSKSVTAGRDEWESYLEGKFAPIVQEFLTETISDAATAYASAPHLIAAGTPSSGMPKRAATGKFIADPFSYTQVMKRWYGAVQKLAIVAEMDPSDQLIQDTLVGSHLPTDVFEDVKDVLTASRSEGWTEYKTKRQLSAVLIPKESSGSWDTRAKYRNSVKLIARSLATVQFNEQMHADLEWQGYASKTWVSRHDERVRHTHVLANGQEKRLGERFEVGGALLRYPGDKLAPVEEWANCRCVIVGGNMEFDLVASAATEPTEKELVMWHGIIGMEQTLTGDGRLLEDGSLKWDENVSLPLRYVSKDVGAHDGAEVVGTIQFIERRDGGEIYASGHFDGDSEAGREAIRQVTEGLTTGVSMDLDDVAFEVRVARDVAEQAVKVEDGEESPDDAEELAEDSEGRITTMKMNPDDEVHVTTSARIRAATLVAIPAFAEARIEIMNDSDSDDLEEETVEDIAKKAEDDGTDQDADDTEEFNWVEDVGGLPRYIKRIARALQRHGMTESRAISVAVGTVKRWARGGGKVTAKTRAKALKAVAEWEAKKVRARATAGRTESLTDDGAITASAAPNTPPAQWFRDPKLTEPTAISVTEDGHVYGHLATWDSCHIAHADFCTSPPNSRTGYAYFHTGAVIADDGQEIAVGHLTLNTTHANGNKGPVATLAHYENTGLAAADVRAGEDEYGIWIAGAVRPNVSKDDIRALRAAPLSGDWRRVQGNLELVAALAVNVPGFPVPRPKGLVASGEMQSLVASGMVPPKRIRKPGTEGALSTEDIRYLKSLANRERKNQIAEMARKINETKVERMASTLGMTH